MAEARACRRSGAARVIGKSASRWRVGTPSIGARATKRQADSRRPAYSARATPHHRDHLREGLFPRKLVSRIQAASGVPSVRRRVDVARRRVQADHAPRSRRRRCVHGAGEGCGATASRSPGSARRHPRCRGSPPDRPFPSPRSTLPHWWAVRGDHRRARYLEAQGMLDIARARGDEPAPPRPPTLAAMASTLKRCCAGLVSFIERHALRRVPQSWCSGRTVLMDFGRLDESSGSRSHAPGQRDERRHRPHSATSARSLPTPISEAVFPK